MMTRKSDLPAVPAFLDQSFCWDGLGYSFAGEPTVDLMSPRALSDADSWIRLASVLEHAKHGEHGHVAMLRTTAVRSDGDPMLSGTAQDLLADAGLTADLEFLASTLLDTEIPGAIRSSFCHAALCAGEVWLVEYMLACYRSIERLADRELIAAYVSSLLEASGGSLEIMDNSHDPEAFARISSMKLQTLLDELGTDQLVVFEGRPFDVHRAAWSLRRAVMQQDHGAVGMLRRKFEPYTGLDCREFYEDGRVNFRGIRDVLDQFDAQNAARGDVFEPGKRFFFGHPVPGGIR